MSAQKIEAGPRVNAETGLRNVGLGSFDASEFKLLCSNRQVAITDASTGSVVAIAASAAAARAFLLRGCA